MNAAIEAMQLNGKRQRAVLGVLLVCVLAGLLWGLLWWLLWSRSESTDNAYVGGNQVQITAQVPGTVAAIHVDDTQAVRAGEVLVELDATDASVALARARANLAQAVRQARQMRETAAQNQELLAGRQLELDQAEADLRRREPLLAVHAMAPELVQHARDHVAAARAALLASRSQAAAARALVEGNELAEQPAVQAARATFIDAWLGAQRTRILAPVAGAVVQRTVQLGNHVDPGLALMRVVPLDQVWIDANFKETQLRNLRIGQPAEVEVDLYGGDASFHAHVAGFSAGTGAAFALLPPQNAAGNWVKVVQRVPVRIALDAKDLARYPLRLGLSAHVSIDTRDRSGPRLAPLPAAVGEQPVGAQTARLELPEAEADRIIAANAGRADARQ